MRRPYKHIDLEDKFSDFEFTPNDSVWDNISGGLNPKMAPGNLSKKFSDLEAEPAAAVWKGVSAAVNPQGRKKALAFWFQTGTAAAAAVFACIIGMSNLNNTASTAYIPRGLDTMDSKSSAHEDSDDSQFIERIYALANSQSAPNDSDDNRDLNSLGNNDMDGEVGLALQRETNPSSSTTVQLTNYEDFSQNQNSGFSGDSTIIFKVDKDYLHPKRVHSIYTDNGITPVEIQPINLPSWRNRPYWDYKVGGLLAERTNEVLASNNWNSTDGAGVSVFTENDPQSSGGTENFESLNSLEELGFIAQEEFSTPVSFSLNAETKLAGIRKKRLKLGLGLGFLKFKSKLNLEDENTTTEITRERTYATVPIYLKYNFIEKRNVDVYVKSGSTVELGLSGKQESVTQHNTLETTEQNSSSFLVGAGQVNVNAGLGSEFRITSRIHGFGEVNIAHYVAQSEYTYWSNQKFWPFINTGISFKVF